ncbi:DUF4959 domain-containing protein [Niastella populi]|uniref:DUF4959 domain-containing protein n=1 Tax=Niastella populi TaxID=550983 RepID=A0A1V9GA99_9BACT|nr:DUF5000 domain-containing lipoprotein [Niastella populi]OQP67579.1 hypothetical protein A4R26_12245 [Niastella populi]
MKLSKHIITGCLLVVITMCACKKDERSPLSKDKTAPDPIRNPQVTNLAGAALITYTLPGNENLLYVKALYTLNGQQKEVKVSMFQNKLLVEGFGNTDERVIDLYAVSRSEIMSEPVSVTIKPLTPPIVNVFKSLKTDSTFGGINVKYVNADSANIVFEVLVVDSAGDWQHVDFNYTSMKQGAFNIRGFPPVERTWGIYARDRWDNHSDTLKVKITPVYEEALDKTRFNDVRNSFAGFIPQFDPLPNSGLNMVNAVDYSGSYPMRNLYDGNHTSMFHTKEKYDLPVWIPIDLDKSGASKFVLSRFKIWQRTGAYIFNHGNPHHWEIWGTNKPNVVSTDPNNTDPNTGWVKLGEYVMTKPSGWEVGQNSNEDVQAAAGGQEFELPNGIPAVRYIGWKNIDSWGSIDGFTGFFHLFELSIWGQKK